MHKKLMPVVVVALAATLLLSGCHKLGLVKSAPKKPASTQSTTTN